MDRFAMRYLPLIIAIAVQPMMAGVGSIGGNPYASFDTETLTYRNNILANTGTIAFTDLYAVDHFVKSAKSNGYWNNLLEVGPFSGDDLAAAVVKLKAYTGLSVTLTNTGFVSGDYSRTIGLTGGTGKWFDTGFNALAYGSKNVGISFFINDEYISGAGIETIGQSGAIPAPFVMLNDNTAFNGSGGSLLSFITLGVTYNYGVGKGFRHAIRKSDSLFETFLNGQLAGSYTTTDSSAPQPYTFAVFAGRHAAGAKDYYPHRGSFYAIDDGTMTDNQCSLFAEDVLTMQRALARLIPAQRSQMATFLIGQSLATGSFGTPTLSTNQIYQNRSVTATSGAAVTNLTVLNLPPLREPASETPASGFANLVASTWRISHPGDSSQDLVVFNEATGSASYAQLKKGGSLFNYTYSLQAMTNLNAIIADYATNLIVPGLICVHGETDQLNANYGADIAQWQTDYETDIKAITGQTNSIPIFHTQISAWTSTGISNCVSPYQVLSQYELEPTKTILVGPKYIFTYYTDGIHLTNSSYRWLGEYYAKAWTKVVVQGGTWSPLYPTSISRTSSNIDLTFSGNVGTLVLDTNLVSDPGNYGFEYTDDSSPPSISSVAITATNIVRVTLASTPTGANKKIRYAYTGIAGNSGGPTTGPRGNLRDSDTTFTSNYGNTLYNWCVHFDKVCP